MRHERAHHSCLYIRHSVYVFGGSTYHSIASAERFDLSSQQWIPLPNMLSPRSFFNACCKDKFVYLCGGRTVTCETFNLDTEVYTLLPVALPELDWVVSLIYKDELVVITNHSVHWLKDQDWEVRQGRLPAAV